MDPDAVTSNPDYYKNGYPESWQRGYTAGLQGELIPASGASKDPAWHDGHTRGTADRNTQPTKENSMTSDTSAVPAGEVDLDALGAELEAESTQQTAAEKAANTTTSSGGFSLLDGMDAELDKGAGKAWIPETPGEQIIGVIESVEEIASEYSKVGKCHIITVRDKAGDLHSVRGYGTVLENRLRELDPHVGDGIGIRFLGVEQPKNQSYQAYKNWSVKLVRAGS